MPGDEPLGRLDGEMGDVAGPLRPRLGYPGGTLQSGAGGAEPPPGVPPAALVAVAGAGAVVVSCSEVDVFVGAAAAGAGAVPGSLPGHPAASRARTKAKPRRDTDQLQSVT